MMIKKYKLASLLVAALFMGAYQSVALAKVHEPVQTFESTYKKKVELPTYFPFRVAEQKTELDSIADQKGIALKLYYLGENPSDMIIVYVFNNYPLRDPRPIDEVVTLADGTNARYRERRIAYFLDFEKKNGLYYSLGVSTSTKARISKEVMQQIANSMTAKRAPTE